MAKSKRLKTEVSYFGTNPPFNKRHEWTNRIGALAHEIHADDAKRDIVE